MASKETAAHKAYNKKYREEHKEEVAAYNKAYRLKNKEKLTKIRKAWYEKNKEQQAAYREKNRERSAANKRVYYEKNKERLLVNRKAYRESHKEELAKSCQERYNSDTNHRIACLLRNRLNKATKGKQRAGSSVRDLGCSIQALKAQFETLFEPGMSWDNHGEWHIDHIIPLSAFDLTDRDQLKLAVHYTNLQPLWAMENFSKGSKIQIDTEMGLCQT